MYEDYVFYMKTIQSVSFKHTVESLKDIIMDVCFTVTKDGMTTCTLDYSKTAIVNVTFFSNMCEEYHCSKDQFKIGLSMHSLFQLIRGLSPSDVLTLSVLKGSDEKIHVSYSSAEKCTEVKATLQTLDLADVELNVPVLPVENEISIPSAEFQKSMRDLSCVSDTLLIKTGCRRMTLCSKGDFAETTIEYKERLNGFSIVKTTDDVIQGQFSMKYICLFSKAAHGSPTLKITTARDFPLYLEYGIGTVGRMSFLLSPKTE